LNIVASKRNCEEVERIIEYGDRIGVYSYFIYLFVPVGRGETVRTDALDPAERRAILELLLQKQREVRAILIPVAALEYWAYALQSRGLRNGRLIRLLGQFLGGCLADKGMVYIKPNGDVWPCPFLPLTAGNVRRDPIKRILDLLGPSGIARDQSDRECTRCAYAAVCGGCKTRMKIKTNHSCRLNS
jgi:radical SAM protein with 4Fe4S-binding SPASM domain